MYYIYILIYDTHVIIYILYIFKCAVHAYTLGGGDQVKRAAICIDLVRVNMRPRLLSMGFQ